MNKKSGNSDIIIKKSNIEQLIPILIETVEKEGTFRLKPAGTSMKPFIRQDIDSVGLVKADSIKKYDIVLYRRESGQYVLHRVMKARPEEFVMCGDNQWKLEHGISKDMIIAKVSEIYRKDKVVSCSSLSYMLCVHLWSDLLPARALYLKIKYRVLKIFKKD